MKLYGHPGSTCTRKVLTVLAEKNHPIELSVVDFARGEQKAPENMTRHPFGQMPTLDDNGFVLYESRAICRYLDAKLPGTPLTPPELKDRAVVDQWASVEQSNFTPNVMKMVYQYVLIPMAGGKTDEKIAAEGRAASTRSFDVMEAQLAKTDFIAGKSFTLADVFYMPYVEYLMGTPGKDLVTSRPAFSRWWERVSTRPSWLEVTGKSK